MTRGPGRARALRAALAVACVAAAGPARAGGGLEEAAARVMAGDTAAARAALDALAATLPVDERGGWSRLLTLRGRVALDEGRLADAADALDAGLAILRDTPHVHALVDNLLCRGQLALEQGDPAGAREAEEEAARWARAVAGTEAAPAVALERARLALALGRLDAARETLREVRPACARVAAPPCEAPLALAEGQLAAAEGRFAAARDHLLAALEAADRAGAGREAVEARLALAEAYRALELPDHALAAAADGAARAARLGQARARVALRRIEGELLLAAGRAGEAEAALEEARAGYEAMRARPGVAASRLVLGRLALDAGRLEEARIHLEAARVHAERLGDAHLLARARRGLAAEAQARGDAEAERAWRTRLVEGEARPADAWRDAARLGALALSDGRRDEAVRWLEAAAEGLDGAEAVDVPRAERAAFREARLATLDAVVQARLGAGAAGPADVEAALVAAERASAAGFGDLVELARLTRDREDLHGLLAAIDAVDAASAALLDAPGSETGRGPQLLALEGRRHALTAALHRLDPRLRGVAERGSTRRIAASVRAVREGMDGGAALLVYHLGEPRSFVFVLRDGRLDALPLPSRGALARDALAFQRALAQPSPGPALRRQRAALAHGLYRALVAPVEPLLEGRRRLAIVPSGELRLVPFDALLSSPPARGAAPAWLVDRYTLSYAPSVDALAELHREARRRAARTDRHALAAFADPAGTAPAPIALPRLRGSSREVERARAHLGAADGPGTLFLRDAASEAALKALALDRYRVVHLATHGFAGTDVAAGLPPALFLGRGGGEDGVLGLDEVLDLRLDADLVVLSACDSGRGPLGRGDGFGGLTGAFLHAGASAVVATLWAIEDTASARLMDVFYGRLAAGAAPAEALRDARLALARGGAAPEAPTLRGLGGILGPDEEAPPAPARSGRRATAGVADPFFWASFVLVGDPGDLLRDDAGR